MTHMALMQNKATAAQIKTTPSVYKTYSESHDVEYIFTLLYFGI